MIVTYLRWRDASHGMEECEPEAMGLADLQEIGWLVQEDEESVTLAMEYQEEVESRRLWLTVPKVNITERRDVKLERLLAGRRKR